MAPLSIPLATYRLQLNRHFRFADARALLPYLQALGITDVYTSPLLKCQRDSSHGYDVCDHSRINSELGSLGDLEDLVHELSAHGMGLVIDVVPNHMGILDPANRWWQDVLENGPSSPYARFFDIDWNPPKEDLVGKVLLPLLGDQYGKVLENGEIRLLYDEGAFSIAYYDHRFPVAPRTWKAVLAPTLQELRGALDAQDPNLLELESVITALDHLPARSETDPESVRERQREKEIVKRRLDDLLRESRTVAATLHEQVNRFNGRRGDPRSFDLLEALLAEQAYRLCFWRVAAEEINYRRFFDVNDLAAIRVEEPEVFDNVHELVLRLVRQGCVTGLRIDHPDGLFDPEQYFTDLQQACGRALAESVRGHSGQALQWNAKDPSRVGRVLVGTAAKGEAASPPFPHDAQGDDRRTLRLRAAPRFDVSEALRTATRAGAVYVVVEKILEPGERLPQTWAVHGTTGYEYLNLLNGIFVDPTGDRPLRNLYARFTGITSSFADLVYESKKLILDVSMSSELHMLARRLDRISEQHRWSRDFTLWNLQEALAEVIACFPVYRTYVRPGSETVSEADRRHIVTAVRAAKRRNPSINESVFDFIAKVLLLENPAQLDETECRDFVMRFQQITAPVMAKGLEDTAFYRSHRLASLNEVGGDPGRFSVSLEQFHQHNSERRAQWPLGIASTSTHDTKRSEDVRARINVLSEIPEDWGARLRRWRSLNRKKKRDVEGTTVPDANEEYLLYQTLLGAWPLDDGELPGFSKRIAQYMVKAARERKVHTSWISPNQEHEQALVDFVEAVLDAPAPNPFLEDFLPFQQRVAFYGAINSLSQVLLKITSPGVPDFYQGTELWDFSLVDPDNRRPVDFALRERLLDRLRRTKGDDQVRLAGELATHWQDGRVKQYVTYKALHLRHSKPELFLMGDYVALRATGARAEHVCCFARRHDDDWSLTVIPRWLTRVGQNGEEVLEPAVWSTTSVGLPQDAPRVWRDVLTGVRSSAAATDDGAQQLPLEDVFRHFPVALLAPAHD